LRGVHLQLERDVLLRHLTPEQIEERFKDEAVGPSVADWLRKLRAELSATQIDQTDAIVRFWGELAEIEAIDPSYSIERAARARRLEEKYRPQLEDGLRRYRAIDLQLKQFTEVAGSVKTWSGFESFMNEWEVEVKRSIEKTDEVGASLQKRLSAIYDPPGGGDRAQQA
jgi:hypothetical protein